MTGPTGDRKFCSPGPSMLTAGHIEDGAETKLTVSLGASAYYQEPLLHFVGWDAF